MCGLELGWAEVIRQAVSFLLVFVSVCGVDSGLGGHNQASNIALAANISNRHLSKLLHYCEIFLSRFLISFVFNKVTIAFGF